MLARLQTTAEPQSFSDQQRDVIAYFFLRLGNVYGTALMQSLWPTEQDLSLAKREYGAQISRFTRDHIHFGIERLKLERENGRFDFLNVDAVLSLCAPALARDMGLISEDEAFSQSLRSNTIKHPWVKEMLRTMSSEDAYELRRADAKTARTLFKKHWDLIIDRVMTGEEAPEVELEIEDKPVKASKETAAEGMAALKGLFGD